MKSVMSRSALGRRVAATAVAGLAASALGLGLAGTAHADTSVTDLEGIVTGVGGAPVANIHVLVEDAATNGGDLSEAVDTDASGHYAFTDLEFDGPVKIVFSDSNSFDVASTTRYYLTRWYGGSRYEEGASSVTLSTDGDTKVNMAMTPAAILAGSVTAGADGHIPSSWNIDLVDADSDFGWNGYVNWTSDATRYRFAVEPGDYRIGSYGWDSGITYLEKWWRDADSVTTATPIAVSAGQVVTGIDIRLTNELQARTAPSISGFPAVGRPLVANPGSWSRNAGTEFSYTWMRGATVVGTGASYVPTAADVNQRLNVVVKALNGSRTGQAASAQTDTVRWPADTKGQAKALGHHKVRFALKLVSANQKPVKGKVVVLRGTKVVHKAVKLVKGKAVIVVKGQPKGKQAYTVLYQGNKTLAKQAKDFTVRVR